jgi:hypothetical protein
LSRVTERDAIRARLVTVLGAVPIAWDAFNGDAYQPTIGTAYFRPRIEDGEAFYSSIGGANRPKRNIGTLIVEVYRPAGEGEDAGNAACDALLAGFKDYQTAGISFMWAGMVKDAGGDAAWHKWLVFLTYQNTETV